ncbi:NAD+ synthase [Endozoicomonas sp. SM1973]|uniref:Glutamine-dependent NAD(+) synthetase n=1 Tax=Spartinivicinus marinus TaxID=2994442 RepID=A0A853I3A0_9GAMM|nr:NAD+ synthase [Spartinivicinus marinus]MCX4025583.1 NAD+ synthase [Spartinivicinus marinus]NYZ65188.1 NAD+ synthase [Spartinivicinus marinus]
MAAVLRIVMAQVNVLVGDLEGNTQRIIETAQQAKQQFAADIVVFPELCICGYPPEDLLLRDSMQVRVQQSLNKLSEVTDICLVLGAPGGVNSEYNQAVVLNGGQQLAVYSKQCLPNYQVFDERRYFVPGQEAGVFEYKGVKIGLTVCEDIWFSEPVMQAKAAGAELILSLNASPFHRGKEVERREVAKQRCLEAQLPMVYVNQIGGQDELVFDGGSFAMDKDGEVAVQAEFYQEGLYLAEYNIADQHFVKQTNQPEIPELLPSIYQALVLGVRDYVNKNGFKGVVLGLSGGIDSALTLAVAVDALGKDRVEAVMMPFRYTSQMSLEDAEQEANTLGVRYSVLPIEPMFNAFMETLAEEFTGTKTDTTEENLQARCRGVLLMAISNKKGYLVLTTGNKSEMAVGYATLYGDMAGGFDVLKDVPKSIVYQLSRYRNQHGVVIPERVIERPPSAELAPDQVDQDSLPPYDILDEILALYIEQDKSAEAIIEAGFNRDDVYRVLRLVDINEYKRRQAAIGVRVTARGFGRDRRYPVVNGWKLGI